MQMKAESRIDSGKAKLSKFSRYWKRQRDWKSFLVEANDVANEMIKLIPSPKLGGGENNICRPKTFNNRRENPFLFFRNTNVFPMINIQMARMPLKRM